MPEFDANSINSVSSYATNRFTAEEWVLIEQAGAAFLPASGYRDSSYLCAQTGNGDYWSSTGGESGCGAFYLAFTQSICSIVCNHAAFGRSVRLVKE